jgi:hypothetical protein
MAVGIVTLLLSVTLYYLFVSHGVQTVAISGQTERPSTVPPPTLQKLQPAVETSLPEAIQSEKSQPMLPVIANTNNITSPKSNSISKVLALPPKPTRSSQPTAKVPKEPLHDPLARLALSMVGSDPDAEEYWLTAINDPSLPAEERSDLIEDLNEDGFADPKNIVPDDLPLIIYRLALIEAVAPESMDKVNADAFEEAYKDLVNMARRAAQQ